MEPTFLNNLGSGVIANSIFAIVYIVSLCLKKKYKHSECQAGCFRCSSDIELTQRSDKVDGEIV